MLHMEHSEVNKDLKSSLTMDIIYVILPSLQLGEIGIGTGEVSDLLVVMKQATMRRTDKTLNFLGSAQWSHIALEVSSP